MRNAPRILVRKLVNLPEHPLWPFLYRFGITAHLLMWLLIILTFAVVPPAQVPRWMTLSVAVGGALFEYGAVKLYGGYQTLRRVNKNLITAFEDARNKHRGITVPGPAIVLAGEDWQFAADLILSMCRFIRARSLDGYIAYLEQESAANGQPGSPKRETVDRSIKDMHDNLIETIRQMSVLWPVKG